MTHHTFVELIAGLDGDLAREYAAVVQNRTYASLVRGPHRPALRRLLAEHAARDLAHAALLADKIAAFGGVPTVRVAPVAMAVHETEAATMLCRLLEARSDAVERYVARRALAESVGEHGLAVDLDDLVAEETRHRDELAMLLRGWEPAPDAGPPHRSPERERRTAHATPSRVARNRHVPHVPAYAAARRATVTTPGGGHGSDDLILGN